MVDLLCTVACYDNWPSRMLPVRHRDSVFDSALMVEQVTPTACLFTLCQTVRLYLCLSQLLLFCFTPVSVSLGPATFSSK